MQQLKSYFHFHIPGRDQLTRSMYPRCSLNKQLRRLSRYRVVRAIHDVAQPPSVAHPVIYHPDFQLSPLPDDHRFPMPKDHLLYVRLKELGLANFTVTPAYPSPETIMMVHEPGYVRSFLEGTIATKKMRMIGLPWSETLVKRTMIGTGSAIAAARTALEQGVACTCNGGTHHAHRDYGTGWCIFNDLAVAARVAQRQEGVGQILFVDLDVHQGDGTATIFQGDPSVYTFSVHCGEQSFPHVLQTSDFDVPLPAGTTDSEYLRGAAGAGAVQCRYRCTL
eukprot:jgi/Botrbrau1/18621/Bobra.0367s0059.2